MLKISHLNKLPSLVSVKGQLNKEIQVEFNHVTNSVCTSGVPDIYIGITNETTNPL